MTFSRNCRILTDRYRIRAEEQAQQVATMEMSQAMAGEKERPQARGKRPRSAVTSGRKLLMKGDPNSAWSRRYHDILSGHVADLGGANVLSEAQAALCRDAACLELELERMRGRLSEGEEIDLDLYGRIAGQRRRILETLGLERRAKDVTTIDGYLNAKPRQAPETAIGASFDAKPLDAPQSHSRDGGPPCDAGDAV
jgi:hypothetical protein